MKRRYTLSNSATLLAFSICFFSPGAEASNDQFETPATLTGHNVVFWANPKSATNQQPQGEPAYTGARTIWFTWRAPDHGRVEFTDLVDGDPAPRTVSFFIGNRLMSLVLIDSVSGYNPGGTIQFYVQKGQEVRIAVGTNNSSYGDRNFHFRLYLNSELFRSLRFAKLHGHHNDFFHRRFQLGRGRDVSSISYSQGATEEIGEPPQNRFRTIWFEWQAPQSRVTKIQFRWNLPKLSGDNIFVYTGDWGRLKHVARARKISWIVNPSHVRFRARKGVRYKFCISLGDGVYYGRGGGPGEHAAGGSTLVRVTQ